MTGPECSTPRRRHVPVATPRASGMDACAKLKPGSQKDGTERLPSAPFHRVCPLDRRPSTVHRPPSTVPRLPSPVYRLPSPTPRLPRLDSNARGVSSAGRASGLQPEGHRFDPDTLHRLSRGSAQSWTPHGIRCCWTPSKFQHVGKIRTKNRYIDAGNGSAQTAHYSRAEIRPPSGT